jgi:hypothetical protein
MLANRLCLAILFTFWKSKTIDWLLNSTGNISLDGIKQAQLTCEPRTKSSGICWKSCSVQGHLSSGQSRYWSTDTANQEQKINDIPTKLSKKACVTGWWLGALTAAAVIEPHSPSYAGCGTDLPCSHVAGIGRRQHLGAEVTHSDDLATNVHRAECTVTSHDGLLVLPASLTAAMHPVAVG